MAKRNPAIGLNEAQQLNRGYLSNLKTLGAGGQVRGFIMPTGVVSLIGTPTIALASGILHEAVKQATDLARKQGNAELAKQQGDILTKAIQEAWSKMEDQAEDIANEKDPLYEPAMQRMAQRARQAQAP